jgi:hypothetical protein
LATFAARPGSTAAVPGEARHPAGAPEGDRTGVEVAASPGTGRSADANLFAADARAART